jgi:anti-sigma factor RsiW
MSEPHVRTLLGGYSLGILDADEQHTVDEHIAVCAECRMELAEVTEATELLALLPADEARSLFQDEETASPPVPVEDDLVLRRTLRAVRAERSSSRSRRLSLVAAGIAVLVAGSVASGYVAGDRSGSQPGPVASGSATPSAVPGARTISGTDAGTGVAATVNLVPVGNWVRLAVKVKGVPPGERCKIIAISKAGNEQVAGSWVIGQKPPPASAPGVPGSAAIAPAELAAVAVETEAGKRLVTVAA